MTDNSTYIIEGSFDWYTGDSYGEYPSHTNIWKGKVDFNKEKYERELV